MGTGGQKSMMNMRQTGADEIVGRQKANHARPNGHGGKPSEKVDVIVPCEVFLEAGGPSACSLSHVGVLSP